VERWVPRGLASAPITRRRLLLGAGIAGAAAFGLAGCKPSARQSQQSERAADGGLVFLSSQLRPVEEAEKMRKRILADYDGTVSFVGSDIGPFMNRLRAEAAAGRGRVALVGSLHGDLLSLAADGLLLDVGDLASELADRNFNPDFLELARFGGSAPLYIPWMQATYLMAARREAVDMLPPGADISALTYDEVLAWAARVNREQGGRKFGFPAARDGLLRRFLQGYSYPSFTGALHTRFKSADAVTMWEWMKRAWAESNRRSPTYAFMQQPLRAGEVWIAWDHVARLVDALKAEPAGFMAFPAPTGPKGLGYVPVLAGLAIPKSSPDREGAKRLIRYLTQPSTSEVTLREVGFFPPTTTFVRRADLGAGIRAEAEAVRQQTTNPKAVASLLPMGLKDKSYEYDEVFRAAFHKIVVQGQPTRAVLEVKGRQLQSVLDLVQARCWQPDPPSSGTCRVGG
jgi:multiple sugar transport system substrate-binding protein